MTTQSIGKNLVYQRKLKGFTQNKLAELSDVTIRTIQRIEKGDVNPQLQTIKLLANALEIEVDDILVIENPKEESVQNKWLLMIHGSPMVGFIFPLSILLPLFLWIHKRDDNPIYDAHAVKVINFQISVNILFALALISLVTIQGWGFLFFILVIPFNFIVISYNVIRIAINKKCFYPLSYPFLKSRSNNQMKKTIPLLFLLAILTVGCSSIQERTQYDKLAEFEGKYEYFDNSTLDIQVSQFDTIVYAIINNAKYPLKHIGHDSFANNQNIPVVFQRDKENNVISYNVSNQTFKLISKEFEKIETLPRKELFSNPDDYSYKRPIEKNDGLKTGILHDEFENPELILEMVKETVKGTYSDVHSVLIYKNDKLVLEEYFYGYDMNTPHQLRSATKPFIGGILGISIDKGIIKSEKESLLPFFASMYDDIANIDNRKKSITIEDMLTYRHGLDCENSNPKSKGNETSMMESDDWVKFTLDLPTVKDAGEESYYCTGCALVLGSLVEIVADEKIEDFAEKNLFGPMGITNYDWTFEPNKSSRTTFSTMRITPRDLVKLAKMYSDGGTWNGKQILSKRWVDQTFDMDDGDYGYLWKHKYFTIDGKRYDSYMSTGNGGQKINIWPELDMITVFTGGNYNSYALYGKATPPNEMIPKYILRSFDN